jgi:hypothetical protein
MSVYSSFRFRIFLSGNVLCEHLKIQTHEIIILLVFFVRMWDLVHHWARNAYYGCLRTKRWRQSHTLVRLHNERLRALKNIQYTRPHNNNKAYRPAAKRWRSEQRPLLGKTRNIHKYVMQPVSKQRTGKHSLTTTGLLSDAVLSMRSASRPCRFTPGERAPGTHWIGSWVDPRAGLDDLEKRKYLTLPGLELRPLGRPARS